MSVMFEVLLVSQSVCLYTNASCQNQFYFNFSVAFNFLVEKKASKNRKKSKNKERRRIIQMMCSFIVNALALSLCRALVFEQTNFAAFNNENVKQQIEWLNGPNSVCFFSSSSGK